MATNQPTPPWPSHRALLPSHRLIVHRTSATTPSKNPCHFWHQSRPTPCPPKAAKPLTEKLGERRKSIDVWINNGTKVEKTLALLLPLVLKAGLGKTCSRLRSSTIIRKGTTWGTALSPERTCQKTSIGLGNFCSNDWH